MAKSLIGLDVLSFDICSDIGDSVYKHRAKMLRHLISGYSEVSMYIGNSFSVKTAVLKIDNAIELPCDFIYETKVGIRNPKTGRIAMLTLDKGVEKHKLTDSETRDYLLDIWNGFNGWGGYYFYNAYNGTNFLGELYGTGRCIINNGTYNIDKNAGVIYIGSNVPKGYDIVIEYKSDGFSEGLNLVPMEMKNTLVFYAKWQFYLDRDNAKAANFERLYKRAYNKIQRLYNFESALYATGEINKMFSPTNC